MDAWILVLTGIVVLLLIIGIIRIIHKSPEGFGDFLMQIVCIDLLVDLIVIIFKVIGLILEAIFTDS